MISNKSNISKVRLALKQNIIFDKNFTGPEKERKQILNLLQNTVRNGESNSALLIGPRGSGKTRLVNDVLEELTSDPNFSSDSVIVKLNGLVHTDDRVALKSITSQMKLDNVVDGKVFGSFAENLAFLLACLKTGSKVAKSILFILEEFDLFCGHHNQTLLYNLFDVSQSAQAPICVLGITCRLDVTELLEKRVKSRFSHRQYFLFFGADKTDGFTDLDFRLKRIENFLLLPEHNDVNLSASYVKQWNRHIKQLVADKKFKSLMQRLLNVDLSERPLKNILMVIISQLNDDNCKLDYKAFEEQMQLFEKDDTVQTLRDLSVLELCLIIAMKHHSDIYDNQPMNFEMVLTRYVKFANANSSIQTVQRPVIMKAFEHIQNLELIQMIGIGGSRGQKEYQLFQLLVTPQQIAEAVKKTPGLPTEVIQWANSAIL